MLYAVIGVLRAIGSIVVFRRIFQGRWEQIFWSSFLVAIAAFYLSFAAYFGAQAKAWQTELVFVALILACAVCGLFYRPAIAFRVMSFEDSTIAQLLRNQLKAELLGIEDKDISLS